MSFISRIEESVEKVAKKLFSSLHEGEYLTLGIRGESSLFTRFKSGAIRQTGEVSDAEISFLFVQGEKSCTLSLPFLGEFSQDESQALQALSELRQEARTLPNDPFAVRPEGNETSRVITKGQLPLPERAAAIVAEVGRGTDLTGLLALGPRVRALYTSAGAAHFFANETYCLEYSMFHPSGKAVKATLAGQTFDEDLLSKSITQSQKKISLFNKPLKKLLPGEYRTFLEPAAVADFVHMLNWNGLSERSFQMKSSALLKMREEGMTFSPLFTLQENFSLGNVPAFNESGERAPQRVSLIEKGILSATLISKRSALEFGVTSNRAPAGEYMRAPELLPGTLEEEKILPTLGTGISLSHVHYLNWSDPRFARVTGMTRYAPFWVEGGELVAPIEDMRFDDTLYALFGKNLEALTVNRSFEPEVGTYEERAFGGITVPGALLSTMQFPL